VSVTLRLNGSRITIVAIPDHIVEPLYFVAVLSRPVVPCHNRSQFPALLLLFSPIGSLYRVLPPRWERLRQVRKLSLKNLGGPARED